jgi:hypothetical protein
VVLWEVLDWYTSDQDRFVADNVQPYLDCIVAAAAVATASVVVVAAAVVAVVVVAAAVEQPDWRILGDQLEMQTLGEKTDQGRLEDLVPFVGD